MASKNFKAGIVWCVAIGACCLKLAACTPSDGYSHYQAIEALKENMRDPSSVKLRNEQEYKHNGHMAYCGEFNAKNAFGAYPGYSRFMVFQKPNGPSTAIVSGGELSATVDALIDKECAYEAVTDNVTSK